MKFDRLSSGVQKPSPDSLPDGWRVFRLGDLCEVTGGGNLGLTKKDDYQSSGIPAYSAAGQDGYVDVAEFDAEAVVLSSIGARCGRCFYASGKWATLANTQVILPKDGRLDARYLYFRVNRRSFWPISGSAQPFIKPSAIRDCWIEVPPASEQKRIVSVLDTVDAAIQETDAVVEKQEQVKTGLLQGLLTRGLDANGRLRDPEREPEAFRETSDFGMIPKSWSVRQVESIADLQVGYAFKSAWYQDTKGIRVLRGANVGYGQADWSETRRLSRSKAREFTEYELEAGDIVIGMDRPFTQQGFKLTVLRPEDVPSLLVQRVGRFIEKNCDAWYLKGLLNSDLYKRELLSEQQGMDIPHISKTDILSAQMPIPPRTEQSRIGEALERNEKSIASEEQYGEKLQRLKTGLMQDLLTGRVRVPEAEVRVDEVVA